MDNFIIGFTHSKSPSISIQSIFADNKIEACILHPEIMELSSIQTINLFPIYQRVKNGTVEDLNEELSEYGFKVGVFEK